jgi:hypothetical protein
MWFICGIGTITCDSHKIYMWTTIDLHVNNGLFYSFLSEGNTVGSPGLPVDSAQKPIRSTQIFANLLHAFSSNTKASDLSSSLLNPTPLLEAREGLLSILPRVIGTLLSLWGVWNLDEPHESLPSSMALLGTAKVIKTMKYLTLIKLGIKSLLIYIQCKAHYRRASFLWQIFMCYT